MTADLDRRELDELITRLGEAAPADGPASGPRSRIDLSTARLAAHDLAVVVRDPARSLAVSVEIDQLVAEKGATLAIDGARLALAGDHGGHRLGRLLAANPVAGVSGTVTRGDGRLRVDLSGHLADAPDQRWSVAGAVAGSEIDGLRIGGRTVALDRVIAAAEIAGGRRLDTLPLIDTGRTRVGGELELEPSGGALTARGTLEIADLAVSHRRLARTPVDRISGSLAVAASIRCRSSIPGVPASAASWSWSSSRAAAP